MVVKTLGCLFFFYFIPVYFFLECCCDEVSAETTEVKNRIFVTQMYKTDFFQCSKPWLKFEERAFRDS
jgi:hypothetical protein